MHKYILILAFLLVNFSSPGNGISLVQNSNIQVQENSVKVDFPDNAIFHLHAGSLAEINQVVLVYGTNARSCLSAEARQEIDFDSARTVSLDWTWDFTRSGNIPPGAEIWWHWEIQDSAGGKLVTDTLKLTVADIGFTWHKLQSGSVSLYWSAGNLDFGQTLLDQADLSLYRLVKKAGISSPDSIKIYVYPNADDLKNATLHTPDWIGGIAFPEYNTTLIEVEPDSIAWARNVIPHELSHLVTGLRVFNCSGGSLPTWLDEGLARFAEGPLNPDDLTFLMEAIKAKNVPSLTGLATGFAASSVVAENEYTYSGSVVAFMIDSFGADQMDALLGQIKAGDLIDQALQKIYGLDTAGLDRKWRRANGLSPADESTPTPAPTRQHTRVPTLSLWTPVVQVPTETIPPESTATAGFTPSPVTTDVQLTLAVASSLTDTPAPQIPRDNQRAAPAWPFILVAVGAVLGIVLFVFLFLRKR